MVGAIYCRMILAKILLGFRAISSLHFWHFLLVLTATQVLLHSRYDDRHDICNTEHTPRYRMEVSKCRKLAPLSSAWPSEM